MRWSEVGKQIFLILQIANLQILGRFALSQVLKCLRCVTPQITNLQIFMINPQTSTQYYTTLSQNSKKCHLFKQILLFTNNELGHICYICKEKKYVLYLRTCKSLESANHKKDWVHKPKIRKVSHLQKIRQTNKLFKSLQFAEVICGLPSDGSSTSIWLCLDCSYLYSTNSQLFKPNFPLHTWCF